MQVPSSSQWQNYLPDSPEPEWRLEHEAGRAVKEANRSLSDLSQHADPDSRYAERELNDASNNALEAIDALEAVNKDLKERLDAARELNEQLAEQLGDVLTFHQAICVQTNSREEEEEFLNWCRLFLKGDWEYNNLPEHPAIDRRRAKPGPMRAYLLLQDENDRLHFKMRWSD